MTRKEKLIAENPLCCFCGGLKRSENTEHYPPRTLFDNKDRPKGFEFASCISCNDSSRCTDSVVSLFALMSHKEYIKAPKKLNKLAKGVQRNCPISWQQLSSSVRNPEQLNFELKGLVLGSNIVSHIEYFTRKMICATYYYDTKKILPLSTPTDVIIQTEYDRLTGKFPFSEIDLGKFRTLIQGRKNKSDEF